MIDDHLKYGTGHQPNGQGEVDADYPATMEWGNQCVIEHTRQWEGERKSYLPDSDVG